MGEQKTDSDLTLLSLLILTIFVLSGFAGIGPLLLVVAMYVTTLAWAGTYEAHRDEQ